MNESQITPTDCSHRQALRHAIDLIQAKFYPGGSALTGEELIDLLRTSVETAVTPHLAELSLEARLKWIQTFKTDVSILYRGTKDKGCRCSGCDGIAFVAVTIGVDQSEEQPS